MGTYEFKFEFEKLSKSTFSAKVSLLDGWVSSPRMTVDEIDRVTVALYHGCIQASEKLAAIQAKIHDQGSSQDDGVPIALVDTGEFSPDGDVSVMPGLVPA